MKKVGISKDFFCEVTERIKSLKEYRQLSESDVMQDIDENLRKLQLTISHDFSSEVLATKNREHTSDISVSIYDFSGYQDLAQLQKNIDKFKKQGDALNSHVLQKLHRFKLWHSHYPQVEVTPDGYLPELSSPSEEKKRVLSQISQIERIMNSEDSRTMCNCNLF